MGKRCLYLACYDDTRTNRGGLRIHWAIIVAPLPRYEDPESFEKSNTRYHVTCRNNRWEFDRRHIECVRTPSMLCRVLVGTIDGRHLEVVDKALSDSCHIRAESLRWDCRKWVEDALVTLMKERWLRVSSGLHLNHLFAFAQSVSEEVAREGLNVGHGIPITVRYPGSIL